MRKRRKATFSRRSALQASGLGLITLSVGGCMQQLTPRAAQASSVDYQVLSAEDVAILEGLGETLVPGAREAGIAPYVEAGLAADPSDSLLMIRYLDVPAPWDGFYKAGLAALDAFTLREAGNRFAYLSPYSQAEIVRTISQGQPDGWSDNGAPPAPFFYFALRGDAIDVTWGTMEGFDRFEQPYLAHIEPPTPW
ncbi:MAG: gluconate 2-dehydrogenase subunit 3 family protein [Pseudomonadota bacterium]